MVISENMAKLSDGDKQDKLDAELEAQAEALVKRNDFASLTEGLKAALTTLPVCPLRIVTVSSVLISQIRAVLSQDPVTKRMPSGLNDALDNCSVCPLSTVASRKRWHTPNKAASASGV